MTGKDCRDARLALESLLCSLCSELAKDSVLEARLVLAIVELGSRNVASDNWSVECTSIAIFFSGAKDLASGLLPRINSVWRGNCCGSVD